MEFKPILHRLVILHIDNDFTKFLVDCVLNVVVGNVLVSSNPVLKFKLKRNQNLITLLCSRKVSLSRKRKLLAANQGVDLVKSLEKAIKQHFERTQ